MKYDYRNNILCSLFKNHSPCRNVLNLENPEYEFSYTYNQEYINDPVQMGLFSVKLKSNPNYSMTIYGFNPELIKNQIIEIDKELEEDVEEVPSWKFKNNGTWLSWGNLEVSLSNITSNFS